MNLIDSYGTSSDWDDGDSYRGGKGHRWKPASPHLVQIHLFFENDQVEEELQLLIGEVDAQLLERIELKNLEAEDVEQADVGVAVAVVQCLIYLHDKPDEDLAKSRVLTRCECVEGGVWLCTNVCKQVLNTIRR